MQVVCTQCKLNFNAPDDAATGLTCPICRSPLRPAQAAQEAPAAGGGSRSRVLEWDGGTLDELIEMLNSAALAVRVEVLPAGGTTSAGEVHLLAGGVSEAKTEDKSGDDALEALRAVTPARFRVEPRLPNPADGELTFPGPDAGPLDQRPLATLMRYCEDYVLTCAIEVWRGTEHARVEYRKGEITGITVGGIDAPERLSEVIRWTSGNYRLVVPRLTLPDVAPPRPAPAAPAPAPAAAPAPAPAAAPAPAPAAAPASAAAEPVAGVVPEAARAPARTIFGVGPAETTAETTSEPAAKPAAQPERPAEPAAAPMHPVEVPQGVLPEVGRTSKTMFGISAPAPEVLQAQAQAAQKAAEEAAARKADEQRAEAGRHAAEEAAARKAEEAARKAEEERAAEASRAAEKRADEKKRKQAEKEQVPFPPAAELEPPPERRRGARTVIGLPLEAMGLATSPPPQQRTTPTKAQPAVAPQAAKVVSPAPKAPATVEKVSPPAVAEVRPARAGQEGGRRSGPQVVLTRTAARPAEKAHVHKPVPARRKDLPLWMYVGLGFSFGLVLMGVYWAMGILAR